MLKSRCWSNMIGVSALPGMRQCRSVLVILYIVTVLGAEVLVPVHASTWRETPVANDRLELKESGEANWFEDKLSKKDRHFKTLLVDGEYIVIGTRNAVYNISLNTLKENEERTLNWDPNSSDVNVCKQKYSDMTKQQKCANYIQVFGKIGPGNYLVCGTNAFKPMCREYEYEEDAFPSPLYKPKVEKSGDGKCPYDPDQNSTAVFADGNLYAATYADISAKDPLILRESSVGQRLRTTQYSTPHLSEPDFVNSFEIDDKIYFFFRENAVENRNCGKAKFSRIARVCKEDKGGKLEDLWTSFFKARLNCSIPGNVPFHFDEIVSTSDLAEGNYMSTDTRSNRTRMFYGVFNTPENSIWGSAVCAFTYNDVTRSFEGRFKSQETQAHNWLPVEPPTPHPTICVNNSREITFTRLGIIKNNPLMDLAVPAAGGAPLLVSSDSKSRYTAITVDWQVYAADNRYYDIMFIGTDDGRVLKAINRGHGAEVESTVIEDIQVLETNEAVRDLRIYEKSQKLIVVSRYNIVSIPLHRCSKHKSCGDCVALQDPYCSWSGGRCVQSGSGIQNIHTGSGRVCPDGGRRDSLESSSSPATTPSTQIPPVAPSCPVCKCDCAKQASSSAIVDTTPSSRELIGEAADMPISPTAPQPAGDPKSAGDPKLCATKSTGSRSDDEVYTASTLAVAIVISIVVSIIVGFVIGYRVSMCRKHTRNTDEMINEEQAFGSLRKTRNSSTGSSHNYYSEPTKIKNLLANNITSKNPNLPNGSIESKAVSGNKVSKTYL